MMSESEYDPFKDSWPELVSTIHVCQGPPRCDLQGEDAVKAQVAGCIWCKKIRLFDDGTEETTEPVAT